MKLQELIGQTDLDMTLAHVKAFFLGVMSAEKPLPFAKAMDEMLAETPEAKKLIEVELKKLWDELAQNKRIELQNFFPQSDDLNEFLGNAKDQLDYFLTAMSLSGTNTESCKNEDMADLIDELEDSVMDLDDYVSQEKPDQAEGEEMKEMLLEAWQDFLNTLKQ